MEINCNHCFSSHIILISVWVKIQSDSYVTDGRKSNKTRMVGEKKVNEVGKPFRSATVPRRGCYAYAGPQR